MLTNFSTIRKSIARLDWIDQMEREGNFKFITKKEVSSLTKEREKLVRDLCGVRLMKKTPGALFIIDTKKEEIALHEGRLLGIPTIALIDTNCDPELVDYPIPGNDDAIRAIKLFCDLVAGAVTEGRNEFLKIYPVAVQAEQEDAPAVLSEAAVEPPSVPAEKTEEPDAILPIDPLIKKPETVDVLEDEFLKKKMEEEVKLKVKRPVKAKEIKKK